MKRWGLAALLFVILGTLVVQSARLIRYRGLATSSIEQLRDDNAALKADVVRISAQCDSISAVCRELQTWMASPQKLAPGEKLWYDEAMRARAEQAVLLTSADVDELKRDGLSDPVKQLRRDLMAHPEIIPFEGVLGGRMGFYREYEITLLNTSWVFARFDDGHIDGFCWLEYVVAPDTTIHWTLKEARLRQ